jgi:hypothetical protein
VVHGWDIDDGQIMQETPRKYTEPTYTKNYPRLDGMDVRKKGPGIGDK